MSKGLTIKQEAFALAYVKSTNATDAYRVAYKPDGMAPKTVNEAASRLLKNSKVLARIEELQAPARERAGLTADRVLQEISRLCFQDPRKAFAEDGSLKQITDLDDDTAATLAGIEVFEERDGHGPDRKQIGLTKKIKFWDKNSALVTAARHLGLFERDNAQRGESLALQVVLVEPPKRAA